MFASSECQGKRKKRLELKNYWKAYDWSVPNLSKDINLQTQESEQTPKRRNQKNIHTKTHHSQAAESKRQKKKKKSWKQPERNNENNLNDSGFLIRNWRMGGSCTIFFRHWKKWTVNLEFNIHWKQSSVMKEILRHIQRKESLKFFTSRPTLKE